MFKVRDCTGSLSGVFCVNFHHILHLKLVYISHFEQVINCMLVSAVKYAHNFQQAITYSEVELKTLLEFDVVLNVFKINKDTKMKSVEIVPASFLPTLDTFSPSNIEHVNLLFLSL